jgi:hypothetical protein
MTSVERLEAVFAGEKPDRTPILGGWIDCPDYICRIAGVSLDDYWNDPFRITLDAYIKLGMDGVIDVMIQENRDDGVDAHSWRRADTGLNLEDALEQIEKMPSGPEMEAAFDFEKEYAKFKLILERGRLLSGGMVYMPAQWGSGCKFQWYDDFGYENFFIIAAAYPEHAVKLMEIGGAQGYLKATLVARAVKEGLYPHAVLMGEDICSQQGPMISPAFLEKYYAPQLERGLKVFLDAGCRPVWHSDGNVRPLMDMLIACGVQGFQGFQPECGMTLDHVLKYHTCDGNPLIIFGPVAVTTELLVLSPGEVKTKVKEAVRLCEGSANLVLFTSSSISPDIPFENILAMYEAVL